MRLLEDIKFGLRTITRNPGIMTVAVLTLALGIGVNATVFTLSNAVLFKGLPFDRKDRVVYMGERDANRNERFGFVSYPDFRDWREGAKSFKGLSASTGWRVNLSDEKGLPDAYVGAQVSANLFRLIGQKPLIGRDFRDSDEARGAAPVAILTYGLWEQRYGRDPSAIGRTIRINSVPTIVIGVMPKDFAFPFNNDLWMPLVPTGDKEGRQTRVLVVIGRLADGVNIKEARAEMEAIGQNLADAYPTTNKGMVPVVENYNEFYIGPQFSIIFQSMLVAVAFVLLIACANVANLMLARAAQRTREISLRIALGAGRQRIIAQLLVESVMLALAGGVFGWLLALWGTRTFDLATIPLGKPVWIDFSMDYRAFVYLVAISVGTGILFGLVPALRLSRLDVNSFLKDGGRGASVGRSGKHFAGVLVAAELALAVVLLAGAGLMIRSFLSVYQAQLGIKPEQILTMRLELPASKYPQGDAQILFHDRLRNRLEAIPGVETVALANYLPTGGSLALSYELASAPPVDKLRRPMVGALIISPNYFGAVGAPLLTGRAFTDADNGTAPPVVIVNRHFAEKAWPGQNAVGKQLRLFDMGSLSPLAGPPVTTTWRTVIGVAPNIVQNDISPRQIDSLIYLPYRQKPAPDMAIVARTYVPPGKLGTAFRQGIQALDPDLPVYNVWTLSERLERNYWFQRAIGVLFSIFGGVALLLASIGLYATLAHSVSQRTQEIGVRMAVGATAQNIYGLVFGQGLRQLVIGLAIGLAGALALTHILKSVLVQVSPSDPTTFLLAVLVLSLAAALGCVVPAWRAVQVDANEALRRE
jgi:putative ABC transport system permease protein